MCLGIPGRVVEMVDGYADQLALVDVVGAERRINIGMLDAPPRPGDWVLIHMGFALEVVDEEDAARALAGLEMLGSGSAGRVRRRFEVAGVVQGVGFRPFVYAAASELGAHRARCATTAPAWSLEVEGDDARGRGVGLPDPAPRAAAGRGGGGHGHRAGAGRAAPGSPSPTPR